MNIVHTNDLLGIKPGQIIFEPGLITPADTERLGTEMRNYLPYNSLFPGRAHILRDTHQEDAFVLTAADEALPDCAKKLIDDHEAVHNAIAHSVGRRITSALVKLHIHRVGQPHPYHYDDGNNITTATSLIGNAMLNQLFKKAIPLTPGDSFTVFNGDSQKLQPIHGIYHPTGYRTSLVVRSYFDHQHVDK